MKSPLKDSPLRNPGESLDKQIERLTHDVGGGYIWLMLITIGITAFEWWRYYRDLEIDPQSISVFAAIVIPYCLYKILEASQKVKRLKQGRDGEKAVGQYLENLRETSAKIYHDIPAKNFNIDHVVIAKSGIYVIETKTYSKPDSGRPSVIFDGTSLKLNSGVTTDKPLIQVLASSNWLRELIKETTGKVFAVKPVIVFPGWFIEPTSDAKSSDIWVLNPKGLPTFIANSKDKMTSEDINLVSFHLSRYIRSYKET